MTTPFLRSLREADPSAAHVRSAQGYMRAKGFGGVLPLGLLDGGENCWYVYYDIPDGLLEIEVSYTPSDGAYTRRVSGVTMDAETLTALLGR